MGVGNPWHPTIGTCHAARPGSENPSVDLVLSKEGKLKNLMPSRSHWCEGKREGDKINNHRIKL